MRVLPIDDAAGPGEADLAPAYPWPADRPWTRVAMLRSLDGGVAGADGRSRSISSDTDRAVLREIRRLADAIVVGAGTVRDEPYGPLVLDVDTIQERAALGLAAAPALVVVSASLDLPYDAPMFTDSGVRPVVVTAEDVAADSLARAAEVADVVRLPRDGLGGRGITTALHQRGLRRLLCEGGPGLLRSFTADDAVDEIDLTVAPVMPARHGAADHGNAPVLPQGFVLAGLLEHESFLFARYLRSRPTHEEPA
jgi:riboflavin biosynthesis pyrimidine reductase